MTTKLGYSLNSVSRLPDKDHVQFCLDNRGQTLAKDRMIFDTQDADLFGVRHNGPPSWRSVTQICSVSQKRGHHPRRILLTNRKGLRLRSGPTKPPKSSLSPISSSNTIKSRFPVTATVVSSPISKYRSFKASPVVTEKSVRRSSAERFWHCRRLCDETAEGDVHVLSGYGNDS